MATVGEFYRELDGKLQFKIHGQMHVLKLSGTVQATNPAVETSIPGHQELIVTLSGLTSPVMVWAPTFAIGNYYRVATESVLRLANGDWYFKSLTTAPAGTAVAYFVFDLASAVTPSSYSVATFLQPDGTLIWNSNQKPLRGVQLNTTYGSRVLGFAQTHKASFRQLIEQGYGDVGENEDAYYNIYSVGLYGGGLDENENRIIEAGVSAQVMEYDFNNYPTVTEHNHVPPRIMGVDLTNY